VCFSSVTYDEISKRPIPAPTKSILKSEFVFSYHSTVYNSIGEMFVFDNPKEVKEKKKIKNETINKREQMNEGERSKEKDNMKSKVGVNLRREDR
jgi:hypothetical protein